ncbi:uncharacterized protein LOC117807597 [Xyrichtys novacula]|nr:uncharacterized protein LOC117807597 [Xyrichtys novacula]
MHWTVRVTVALLNIIWVFFFLTFDPFSVPAQRRCEDEDIVFGEFCIQLDNKSNNTDTSAEVKNSTPESSAPEIGQEAVLPESDMTPSEAVPTSTESSGASQRVSDEGLDPGPVVVTRINQEPSSKCPAGTFL